MKMYHSIVVFFILMALGFQNVKAQSVVNQFDVSGKRTGVWKKYYNNNRIRYQGQFLEGKETGTFKYYSALSSDHPIAIKIFIEDSNKAKVKFFTKEGVLESKGEMDGKNRIGIWFYYHSDGKSILSEENYKNGNLNGESKTYYLTGIITEFSHFKNGVLHGNLKRYADNGILLDNLNYNNGKLHGAAKYYNIDGKLIYWGDYENDEKVGKWEYFENGKPEDFKNSKQAKN